VVVVLEMAAETCCEHLVASEMATDADEEPEDVQARAVEETWAELRSEHSRIALHMSSAS
jgi:hypothetical protein